MDDRWAANDRNMFWKAPPTVTKLEPGFYTLGSFPGMGPTLIRKTVISDKLIDLPHRAIELLTAEFARFWSDGERERYSSLGLLHKRSILLYGMHGTGKSALMLQTCRQLIAQHGGIGCEIKHPQLAIDCFEMIRQIEPTRPIIATLEDLDGILQYTGSEEHILSLLDGEHQIDGIFYIATTNYPQKLPARLTDRPSRFDLRIQIDFPTAEVRKAYLQARAPSLSDRELHRWVEATEGFSVAYLRELIVLTLLHGLSLPSAINRLRAAIMNPPVLEQTTRPTILSERMYE